MKPYEDFLRHKIKIAKFEGFDVSDDDLYPGLFPHQKMLVKWAVKGGNRGLFASFGMGKSVMQCEWLRIIIGKVGGFGLIVCPLGVRQELIRDAKMLGLDLRFIRNDAEIASDHQFYITNYESVRDGKLTPRSSRPSAWMRRLCYAASAARPIKNSCRCSLACASSLSTPLHRRPTVTKS